MTSLTEFFNKHEDETLKGISHKNSIIKRNIIAHMAVNGECTLSELTKELHISVPTITKLVQELVDENIVTDLGKVETPGGRRPNIFGLANSAIYFAGVNVGRDNMRFLITDLQNNIIKEENDFTFELLDRPQCIERICSNIENFIATCGIDRAKILGLGVCMTGRVNPDTGRSYKYFTTSEQSLRDMIEERVGIRVLLENDTRARCYAEYTCGKSKDESNVLYLHMGRGVAIGIVVDGQLYYGKSGFAGEFGHMTLVPDGRPCYCGKRGCVDAYCSAKVLSALTGGNLALFFDGLRAGDRTLQAAWDEYLAHLAVAVNNLRMIFDCDVIVGGYVGGFLSEFGAPLRELLAWHNTFEPDSSYLKFSRYQLESSALGAALVHIESFIQSL